MTSFDGRLKAVRLLLRPLRFSPKHTFVYTNIFLSYTTMVVMGSLSIIGSHKRHSLWNTEKEAFPYLLLVEMVSVSMHEHA